MINCYDWSSFDDFLQILGIIVLATPNLSDQIGALARDLKLEQIQHGVNASFSVPQSPHSQLYGVAALFGLVLGAYLILLLMGRKIMCQALSQGRSDLEG